jgi:hypothetical protein
MGYRRKVVHYKLKFENPEYEGLEVIAKSLPLGDFLEFQKTASVPVNAMAATPEAVAKRNDASVSMFKMFAENLISWNLETEDGKPVPATYKGIISQDFSFILDIIKAWMDAIASVPKASEAALNGSGTYLEPSIPMELS